MRKSHTSYIYEYSDNGQKTEIETEICGGVTTITTTVTDIMGRELSMTAAVDDEVKSETVNTYDGFGRLTETSATQGDITTVTSSTYDDNDTVLTESDADGTITSYTYDSLSRVTSRNVQKGNLSKTWTTDYGYEDITLYTGTVIGTESGNGSEAESDNRPETVNIKNAYVVTERNPDGYITSQAFTDSQGRVVREKSDGMYTDKQYDKSGNAIAAYEYGEDSDGEGGILTIMLYDENGNQTHTAVNPLAAGSASGDIYNIGGDCIVTENRYDADGNVIASIDGENHKTSMAYDIEGQLRQVVQPEGETTKFTYSDTAADGSSQIITTDAGGNRSAVTTDARGLETKITDYIRGLRSGIQRTYEYDGEGNVTRETELEGNYKTFTSDSKGRNTVIEYHKEDGTPALKTVYTYDINDQITLMQDYEREDDSWSLYRSTKYTYDALKRLSSYTEWNGEGDAPENPTVSYTYDIEGNVTAIDYANTGSELEGLVFEYDSSKKLKKIKADTGGLLKDTVREYGYDDQGRVSTIKDHYGFTGNGDYLEKSYTYDSFGRVTSMVYRGGSSHDVIKEAYIYTYDKNSNITSERIVSDYDRDASGEGRDIAREYTYDADGRLIRTEETDNNDETAETSLTAYTYDNAGNRLTETKDGRTTSYSYNGLNQLTESTSANQTETVIKSYTYDSNGNQISEITEENGDETEEKAFVYDEADRLKTLRISEGDAITLMQENLYNGNGQRIQKKETTSAAGADASGKLTAETAGVSETSGELAAGTQDEGAAETTGDTDGTADRETAANTVAVTTVTDYFYQDGAVLYTEDSNGDISSMNLLGNSCNVIATSRKSGDSEAWYLYNKDIRESTSSIIGENGNAAATYRYDDFGNTTVSSGADFDNEICYTSQIFDKSTGFYYCNARFYDSANARFLTQDTYRGESKQPDTLHLYAYCANNPVNYADPSGHKKVNVNKSKLHWWGVTNYLSYSNAKNLKNSLEKYKTGTDVISLIATGAGLFNVYIEAFAFF